jgi:hypothetical protein
LRGMTAEQAAGKDEAAPVPPKASSQGGIEAGVAASQTPACSADTPRNDK